MGDCGPGCPLIRDFCAVTPAQKHFLKPTPCSLMNFVRKFNVPQVRWRHPRAQGCSPSPIASLLKYADQTTPNPLPPGCETGIIPPDHERNEDMSLQRFNHNMDMFKVEPAIQSVLIPIITPGRIVEQSPLMRFSFQI